LNIFSLSKKYNKVFLEFRSLFRQYYFIILHFFRLNQYFFINRRVLHSFFTMIIIIVTIIISFHLRSHLSSTHCFWFFTHWKRESITEASRTSKDPSHGGGFADPSCRSPSLGVINKIFIHFKSIYIWFITLDIYVVVFYFGSYMLFCCSFF